MLSGILTSRKFWGAVIALVVVIVAGFVPEFELDGEHAAGLAVVVVSYLIGVAVDPGPGGWRGVIQSRKFWSAAIGFVFIWLDAFHLVLPYEMDAEMLITIALIIGGYIGGVALERPNIKQLTPMR